MIEQITIENFKSIISTSIQFSDLTILVGPNGSGKSNLIKGLSFLSDISRYGIISTVSTLGGFSTIVPKSIGRSEARGKTIRFHYRVLLPELKGYPDEFPPISAEHILELGSSTAAKGGVRVKKENLAFHQVLAVAALQARGSDEGDTKYPLVNQKSTFVIQRGAKGGISYNATPPLYSAPQQYLEWLGFSHWHENLRTQRGLKRFLDGVTRRRRRDFDTQAEGKRKTECFLDPDAVTELDFSSQYRVFRRVLRSTRRYDLLLDQLRTEQPASRANWLAPDGSNLPSVLRRLGSDPDRRESLDRILGTLGEIAPHIETLDTSTLRTGKEFVEFEEFGLKRGIESWDTSDGTLRALAILLALEMHPANSTILIEEPEQNLHPWAVRSIMEHIREVIRERRLQVILTTHSQQVLEQAYPSEVLVTSRTEEEGTQFHTLREILPNADIRMGEVGELWVSGLLGGVPAHG